MLLESFFISSEIELNDLDKNRLLLRLQKLVFIVIFTDEMFFVCFI